MEMRIASMPTLVLTCGPHRVDFLFGAYCFEEGGPCLVAVECDGHEFHERDKTQAARDKSRDRDPAPLQGIQVLRFTGFEIHRDAAACAMQVVALLAKRSDDPFDRMQARIEYTKCAWAE